MKKRSPFLLLIVLALLVLVYFFQSRQGSDNGTEGKFDRNLTPLVLTRHARCRMDCRRITESEIREILQKGRINYAKSEPEGKPDPKYALEGLTSDGQEVRVVFAPSRRGMVVITVIDLKQEWQCSCN